MKDIVGKHVPDDVCKQILSNYYVNWNVDAAMDRWYNDGYGDKYPVPKPKFTPKMEALFNKFATNGVIE